MICHPCNSLCTPFTKNLIRYCLWKTLKHLDSTSTETYPKKITTTGTTPPAPGTLSPEATPPEATPEATPARNIPQQQSPRLRHHLHPPQQHLCQLIQRRCCWPFFWYTTLSLKKLYAKFIKQGNTFLYESSIVGSYFSTNIPWTNCTV